MLRRYAEYIRGARSAVAAPIAPTIEATPGHAWVLQREPDDRWTLRERDGRGVISEPRLTSDPTPGVVDATFWAGDQIDIGTGRWHELVNQQCYEWQEDHSVVQGPGSAPRLT
jgi:hypothetical protein